MLLTTAHCGFVEVEGQRRPFKGKRPLTEDHSGRCSGEGRHGEGGQCASLLLCRVRGGKAWTWGESV